MMANVMFWSALRKLWANVIMTVFRQQANAAIAVTALCILLMLAMICKL